MSMFTDNDLKRLKEVCLGTILPRLEPEALKALLARLSAAEKACETMESLYTIETPDDVKEAIDEWRKAAGK